MHMWNAVLSSDLRDCQCEEKLSPALKGCLNAWLRNTSGYLYGIVAVTEQILITSAVIYSKNTVQKWK